MYLLDEYKYNEAKLQRSCNYNFVHTETSDDLVLIHILHVVYVPSMVMM